MREILRNWVGGGWLVVWYGAGCARPEPLLEWEPCAARVPEGADGECAVARLPIHWNGEEEPALDVAVKRFPTESPQGQIWILDGGPGGNGWAFESAESIGTGQSLVDHLRERGWDVYIPSHRGTGLSTALRCSDYLDWESEGGPMLSADEAGPCAADLKAEWGDDLAGFNSVDAAEDILALAAAVRAEDGGRQAVYSTSYGGYWAQRMMKADPAFWDAIVLDSPLVIGADVQHTERYGGQTIGRLFSDVCASDPACTTQLGEDPLQTALEVLAGLEAGIGCPEVAAFGLDADLFVEFLQVMIGSFAESVVMAPPLVRRLDRCSESDVAELEHLVEFLIGKEGNTTTGYTGGGPAPEPDDDAMEDPAVSFFNAALSNNVIALDLWPVDVDLDLLEGETLTEPFATFDRSFAAMVGDWPRPGDYRRDDTPPAPEGAVLVTQGGLDMATTPDWSAGLDLDGPGQWRVVFPVAGHGTPIWTIEESGTTSCALSVQLAFLDDPTRDPTLDCIEDHLDFDGEAESALSAMVYGTDSVWGTADP